MSQQSNTLRDHPIVLFDGVCNLCNGTVAWIIRRDSVALFRFAAMQSLVGRQVLRDVGVDADASGLADSVVLVHGGRVFTHSDATLGIARMLGFPWSWIAALGGWLPRSLRDWAYLVVARHRYRLFGRADKCMVPTQEVRSRFLDEIGGHQM